MSINAKIQTAGAMKKKSARAGKSSREMSPEKILRVEFTVLGDYQSLSGNPMPKIKLTGRQHWLSRAQNYTLWKAKVVASLLDQTKNHPARYMMMRNLATRGKPFKTASDCPGRMEIEIFWKNGSHGDPENVFGSIADALFFQDKYLDGSFSSRPDESGQGRVDIKIKLQNT